jgi:hypothetical protein
MLPGSFKALMPGFKAFGCIDPFSKILYDGFQFGGCKIAGYGLWLALHRYNDGGWKR